MRASDRAYAILLQEIQGGTIAPGSVLAEVEQAERLGVSRTPLREAIGRLVADGLAVQLSPRVTVVSDFDEAEIRALFVTRRALEESSARIAAQAEDRSAFTLLASEFSNTLPTPSATLVRSGAVTATTTGANTSTGTGTGVDAYYALIARFDATLDEAVANAYLTAALRTVRTHLVRARRLARDNRDRLAASAAEHALIARAIAAGDPDLAAHATHVHLHNALTSILTSIREGHS